MVTITFSPKRTTRPVALKQALATSRSLKESLFRKGLLATSKFFSVVEFHKSGWPHVHMILDSKPETSLISLLNESQRWARRSRFGVDPVNGIDVSEKRKNEAWTPERAARYLTKTLRFPNREMYRIPGWAVDKLGRRISRSDGLLPSTKQKQTQTQQKKRKSRRRNSAQSSTNGCLRDSILHTIVKDSAGREFKKTERFNISPLFLFHDLKLLHQLIVNEEHLSVEISEDVKNDILALEKTRKMMNVPRLSEEDYIEPLVLTAIKRGLQLKVKCEND